MTQLYKSIHDSGKIPEGWEPIRGGTRKVNIKNKKVLMFLREKHPGDWKKVYSKGVGGTEVHYFQHKSGLVFDVKVI